MKGALPISSPRMFVEYKTNEQRGSGWEEEFLNARPTELWPSGLAVPQCLQDLALIVT